jgi:Spy/CpxP family protein refolding chaperone
MRTSLFGMGLLGVILAGGALSAQHHGTPSAQHKVSSDHQFLLHLCAASDGPGGADAVSAHHAQVATALGLSVEQLTTVNRVTTEACAAMKKYHEQIMAVLTPEQRQKLHDMHGGGHGEPARAALKGHGGY